MKRNTLAIFCLLIIVYTANAAGFDVKTISLVDQPNIEILGDYKGQWYSIGFEVGGNLNKPPQYKIIRYNQGLKDGKTSILYPSFGEKVMYLKAGFVNNKISLFNRTGKIF